VAGASGVAAQQQLDVLDALGRDLLDRLLGHRNLVRALIPVAAPARAISDPGASRLPASSGFVEYELVRRSPVRQAVAPVEPLVGALVAI
jgi:hypothetical protein